MAVSMKISAAADLANQAIDEMFAKFGANCQELMDLKVENCVTLLESIEDGLLARIADDRGRAEAALLLEHLKRHMRAMKSSAGQPS